MNSTIAHRHLEHTWGLNKPEQDRRRRWLFLGDKTDKTDLAKLDREYNRAHDAAENAFIARDAIMRDMRPWESKLMLWALIDASRTLKVLENAARVSVAAHNEREAQRRKALREFLGLD